MTDLSARATFLGFLIARRLDREAIDCNINLDGLTEADIEVTIRAKADLRMIPVTISLDSEPLARLAAETRRVAHEAVIGEANAAIHAGADIMFVSASRRSAASVAFRLDATQTRRWLLSLDIVPERLAGISVDRLFIDPAIDPNDPRLAAFRACARPPMYTVVIPGPSPEELAKLEAHILAWDSKIRVLNDKGEVVPWYGDRPASECVVPVSANKWTDIASPVVTTGTLTVLPEGEKMLAQMAATTEYLCGSCGHRLTNYDQIRNTWWCGSEMREVSANDARQA